MKRAYIVKGNMAFMRLLSVVFRNLNFYDFTEVSPETVLSGSGWPQPDLMIVIENLELYRMLRSSPNLAGVPILVVVVSDADLPRFNAISATDRAWVLKNDPAEISVILNDIIPSSKEKRVLCVDDSPTVLKQIRKAFAGTPYILQQAENGRAALDALHVFRPDLVLTDIEMPVMDGLEFCRNVRQIPGFSETPLIILSSRVDYDTIARGFECGADEYLTKPFHPDELLNKVESYLVPPPSRRKESILILSPSDNIIHQLHLSLQKQGFDVGVSRQTAAAFEIVAESSPDLIICDSEVDGMTGFQFCTQIRNLNTSSRTPFVLISGQATTGARKMGEKVGVTAYLTKPFTREGVIVLVERLLAEHRSLKVLEWNTVLSSIEMLARALDERDSYTKFHSENVSRFAVAIGRKAGMHKAQLENLRLAGLLHDIGKIGIPDSVLNKPARLTPEEFELIKEHSHLGAEILSPIPILENVVPAILHHHERIDGGGYPAGLKGDDIPAMAQIMAVADTWDALVTDRPYRKGMKRERALEIMRDVSGTQLSPRYVELFLKWLDENPDFKPN